MEILDIDKWTYLKNRLTRDAPTTPVFCGISQWFQDGWCDFNFKYHVKNYAYEFLKTCPKYKDAELGNVYLFKFPYQYSQEVRIDFCNYMIEQCNKNKPTFKSKLIKLWKKYFY
jgi:hypothetical protein